tara:strand:- start:2624 stop:3145 length:522 start_codon:yes stop_codon:yes gene_type:complete
MLRAVLFTLVVLSGTTIGEEKKPFNQEGKVLSVLKSYIGCVDEKNVEGMLEHITIPLDLHFGSQQVTTIRSKGEFEEIFNRWNNSEKSNFHATKIKSVDIEQTGLINNMLAVVDVTYERLSESGEVIRTERALYHLVRGNGYYAKPLKFVWALTTRWARKWNIYMISNLDVDD